MQDLGIIPSTKDVQLKLQIDKLLKEVKEFLLELVKHHHLLGQETLIKQAKSQFSEIEAAKIDRLIEELVKEKKISIINPQAQLKERLICLIPQMVAGGKK